MANARIQFSSRQSRITIACIMAGIFDNLEFHASPREHCIRELLAIWPMRKDGEFPTRICFIPFLMFPHGGCSASYAGQNRKYEPDARMQE